jgi:DNA-binding LytR/AlgR family response regulator
MWQVFPARLQNLQPEWRQRQENFVDHTMQQSTLRQLQAFLRSPRFWTTFAVVVALFTITGPYGTLDSMPLGKRLAYWLLIQAFAWGIAIAFSVGGEIVLRKYVASVFARMMMGSLVSALPIGFGLCLIEFSLTGNAPTITSCLRQALLTVPLCALFCVLTYMTMHSGVEPATAPAPAEVPRENVARPATPILKRLKPESRGLLLRLAVRDHYTEVITSRGRELILLRFADAVSETAGVPGIRVHRSHWIADTHVKTLKRDNGRLSIVTVDCTEIPVSRTYAEQVRQRFG